MGIWKRSRSGSASEGDSGHLLAWVALGLALALVAGAFWIARDLQREAMQQRFAFRQTEVLHALRDRLAAYQQTLQGALGLLNASTQVTRTEWRTYVDSLNLRQSYPGIQGVGYALWLRPADVPRVEANLRRTGFPDFTVWPQGMRTDYTTIVFLEPEDSRNRRAIGYDMWSEEVRRAAMARARDSGTAAITGRVRLVQEDSQDVQAGFLMYLPHYGTRIPTDMEERRAALHGFVYAPFRINDFMVPIQTTVLRAMRLRLYSGDRADPDSLLYDSHAGLPWPAPAHLDLHALVRTALPGQVWTAEFSALPGMDDGPERWLPGGFLAVGTLFSLLGFAALRSGFGLRRAEAQNARLGRLIDEASTEMYVLDADDLRVVQANRGAAANLDRPAEELVRLSLLDLQPQIQRSHFDGLSRPLTLGLVPQVTYETVQQRRDGSTYPVAVTLQLHQGRGQRLYHALVQDLSERDRQQQALTQALHEAQSLLHEKEILLREVHHRVKNNLQVIWSLIRLEAHDIPDPAVRERMETVARRISVLGQIHQQLYGADNLARVDIGQHIRSLGTTLTDLHAHQDVSITVTADRLTCDLETAIPIGLIVNELISNSMEHAFPPGRKGHIRVGLHQRTDHVRLEVGDDGVGQSGPGRNGLGMRLVQALTSQLRGTLAIDGGNGTRVILSLPLDAFDTAGTPALPPGAAAPERPQPPPPAS
ncbi:CHASE domain-containing protein [Oleisolibacter albus]|uniref:CHASE domain-containing protein n=1 Tax=Oleisolibacter albus TaxID=2171757 RepID=UPI000DF2ABB5|nr:CHASE domain-containing protein [Oleisolibacter albus]